MRTARSTSRRASATDVDRWGTKLGVTLSMEPSARTENTKVPTNTPSVTWLPMSRTKFRIMRGPNCCDASVSARIVMVNTTPMTVMTAAAMAMRTWRSASALPVRIQNGSSLGSWDAARSISNVTMNSKAETTTRMLGMTHSVVRSSSQRQLGSCRRSLLLRAGCGATTSSWPVMR